MSEMARIFNSPEESRAELLLRRADLNDAIEADAARQRRRRRLGVGVLMAGVLALVAGFTLDSKWFFYSVSAFQIPLFGLGFFLLAGQEVRRRRRELRALDDELEALDARRNFSSGGAFLQGGRSRDRTMETVKNEDGNG